MDRLTKRESLGAGLNRLIQAEVNAILGNSSPSDDVMIHAVRVSAKKLRAYLRLLKQPLGKAVFDEADTLVRDMMRPLRPCRERAARHETLVYLAGFKLPDFDARDAASLEAALADDVRTAATMEAAAAQLRNDINAERMRLDIAHLDVRWHTIASAISRSYARNLNAFENVRHRHSGANLHEWRKQAKTLLYQVAILHACWPRHLGHMEKELGKITRDLGQLHDLALLKKRLRADEPARLSRAGRSALALIRTRRKALREDVIARAGKLYRRKPDAFIKALTRHWQSWRGHTHDAHHAHPIRRPTHGGTPSVAAAS